MTVLVRDVIERISTLLSDIAPQFARYGEAEIVGYLNDFQTVMGQLIPQITTRTDSFKLRAGAYQRIDRIAVGDLLPDDGVTITSEVQGSQLMRIMSNMGTSGTAPGKAVRLLSWESAAAFSPDWQSAPQANVIKGYMFDPLMPTVFMVTPPAKANTWVRMMYQAQPIRIPAAPTPGAYAQNAGSTQAIYLPDFCEPDMVAYGTARAYMRDAEDPSNAAMAQMYTQLFLGSVNARILAMTGSNPNLSVLPLAPAPAAQAAA